METLYRKYRPKNFSEVEGQVHIVKTLKNTITAGRIGHAYLFTGPRGTGKTTIARIFSLALNCLKPNNGDPCGKCTSCTKILGSVSLSIIEIDAASHTGVDNIRQLREEAILPPLDGARYKVYIIDEVHMLSKGAFNALLKILEEPPKHIIFILATTEIQKVPETIISRCQRFDFGRLPLRNIIDKLSRIAKEEKVKLDPEILEMVAVASAGGMRDAESLLSQLFSANDKHISTKEAEEILGFSHRHTVRSFIDALVKNDILQALRHIEEASENGYNLDHFVETLLYQLRRMLFLRVSPDMQDDLKNEITKEELAKMLEQVKPLSLSWIVRAIDTFLAARISMRSSFLPQIPLETAVVKILDTAPVTTPTTPPTNNTQSKMQPSSIPKKEDLTTTKLAEEKKIDTFKAIKTETPSPPSNISPEPVSSTLRSSSSLEEVFTVWQQCLDQTKEKNALLGTFLRNSSVTKTEGNSIFIATSSEFYKNALEKQENRLTIENILGILLNNRVSLHISVEAPEEEKPDPLIQNVMEAFGNAIG